jgi:prepilin peptidase CpaA
MTTLTTALFAALLVTAIVTDVRQRRIPNQLTLAGVVAALVLRSFGGFDPLLQGVFGLLLALAVTVPLVALGGLGAGDSKLLAAVGAFTGPAGFVMALLISGAVGGVLAVAVTVRRGVVLPALMSSKALLVRAVTLGRYGERITLDAPGAVTVPYAIAIGVGSMIAWFL